MSGLILNSARRLGKIAMISKFREDEYGPRFKKAMPEHSPFQTDARGLKALAWPKTLLMVFPVDISITSRNVK